MQTNNRTRSGGFFIASPCSFTREQRHAWAAIHRLG
nr:MAG TPA: hypothetical protein [Caudoviricetes sp.]